MDYILLIVIFMHFLEKFISNFQISITARQNYNFLFQKFYSVQKFVLPGFSQSLTSQRSCGTCGSVV